ncbi:MAG: amidohydrolase [Promethearchaeota archaeon]
MQIFNGNVLTCDENNHVYHYLIEEGGRITYVGDELPPRYKDDDVIALGEKALCPSFGDGHIHFTNWALIASSYFDVRTANNFKDIERIIKDFTNNKKLGKIVAGFGISKHSVVEKRLITRKELDEIFSEVPLVIIGYDGHSLVANSKMVDLFPENVRKLRGFNPEEGHLFNEAYYDGLDFATSMIPKSTLIKGIIKGYDIISNYGIGLIHSVEGIGFPKDMDITLALMVGRAQSRKNSIQTRLFFQTMDVKKVLKRKLPRIGGCFATALDGCFGAVDAALLEPYSNDPSNKGILFNTDEEVMDFVKEANRQGLQIEMHAIGDAAVKQAIMALEYALKDHPRKDHRHTIIHACLLDEEDIQKCVELGLSITLQPGFLTSPLEPKEYLDEILGDRMKKHSPLRSIVDAGIHLSGGSDGPVTHPDPIKGIYGACNHPFDPKQSLTIKEAMRMYTYEVAWMSFDEKVRGSLEPGKIADMVILNKNPYELEPENLLELKVEELFLAGKKYRPGMNVLGMFWNGLMGKNQQI